MEEGTPARRAQPVRPHAANFRPRLISALSERIAEVDAQAARR